MTSNKMYTLVLNVAGSVANSEERYDFEPRSWWLLQEDGSYNVQQRVYMSGGRVVGESGRFEEDLVDLVRDYDRFVKLEPLKA